MSRRKLAYLGTAAAAAVAVVVSTSPAFAAGSTDVLAYGGTNPNGTNVATTTDNLTGSLQSGTTNSFVFTANGSTVTITCTQASLAAKASSNPAAPGTAGVNISALTFSDGSTPCTLTGLSGVTVVSAVLKTGATATVSDGATKLFTITSLDEAVTLHTGLGNIVCDYGTSTAVPSIQGVVTNPDPSGAGGSIVFANDPVALISGSSFCGASGSTGTFSATFAGITDTSGTGTNLAVYVN